MDSKILLVLSVIVTAFLCGCPIQPPTPPQTPEDIAKTNEIVSSFLEEYPDAEVLVIHFESSEFEQIREAIQSDCNEEYAEAKEIYKVKITYVESGSYVTAWIDWENETIECVFKSGAGGEPPVDGEPPADECDAGWKCKDSTNRAYQNIDCSWENEELCEFGCENGVCELAPTDPCAGVSCEGYCSGDTMFHNGVCVDGECEYFALECELGCEDGVCIGNGDSCAGIECSAYCSGETRYYDGSCVDGQCTYSAEVCPQSCENGLCTEEGLCNGVTCSDTCDGNIRKYNGYCEDGICNYPETETCEYACENGVCVTESCAGISCDSYCSDNVLYYGGTCSDGVCSYSTTDCTTNYCDGDTLYSDGNCENVQCNYTATECEFSCESAACVADLCAGIICDDYCEDGTAYSDGLCVDGECEYGSSEECSFGCGDTVCMESGIIFIASSYWKPSDGAMGGISGLDGECQSHASAAGLSGTWIALMSDSSTTAIDRIPDTVYRRIDGALIANSKADLFDGSIANKINLTELGTAHTQTVRVWTGTNSDGSSSGINCNDWGTSPSGNGTIGQTSASSSFWIAKSRTACSKQGTIYCVLTSS